MTASSRPDAATAVERSLWSSRYNRREAHLPGVLYRLQSLARLVVHAAIDHFLLVLSRCRHFGLLSPRGPHSCQGGIQVDFHFVLKDQGFRGILTGTPTYVGGEHLLKDRS